MCVWVSSINYLWLMHEAFFLFHFLSYEAFCRCSKISKFYRSKASTLLNLPWNRYWRVITKPALDKFASCVCVGLFHQLFVAYTYMRLFFFFFFWAMGPFVGVLKFLNFVGLKPLLCWIYLETGTGKLIPSLR